MSGRAAAALIAAVVASACASERRPQTSRDATAIDIAFIDAGTADAAAPPDGATGDGSRTADASSPDAAPPPFSFYAINHVLGTGQSLSTGGRGTPARSLTQPYANMMFNKGVVAPGRTGLTGFVDLVERTVETMSSGFANGITRAARDEVFKTLTAPRNSHDVLVSCHGISGFRYALLKKGTVPYGTGLIHVRSAAAIAKRLGRSYIVRAVTNVHGEADERNRNKAYGANLVQWQADLEKDVRAITGQRERIPMLHTQVSSWTRYNRTTPAIALAQLAASLNAPDKLVLVGPKYHLPYVDGVHLTAHGYRHMGEHYGRVYRHVILEGRTWRPLHATAVARAGTKLTVTFAVPVPPLVLDTKLVTNPGNFGFEIYENVARPAKIVSVKLGGPTTVEISLDKALTGTTRAVRYAYTGKLAARAGPKTGARGNLRDSDETPSRHGYALHNWAVHFTIAVP